MDSISVMRYYDDEAHLDYLKTYKLLHVFCPVVIMLSDVKNQINIITGTVMNSVR